MPQIIGKISKGSKMDQIYIPKQRSGMPSGSYVLIKELDEAWGKGRNKERLLYYHIKKIEPIKIEIIKEIIKNLNARIKNENIFITGSFLQSGFHFNDIDILIIKDSKSDVQVGILKDKIKEKIGLQAHIILLDTSAFMQGLATDPIYEMMLSQSVARKRFISRVKRKIDYKLLDLRLLKSKDLVENFDLLSGEDKYYLVRNMIAIDLFMSGKRLGPETVDREMSKVFQLKDIMEIKKNLLDKESFLRRFKEHYERIFKSILLGIEHESKQKRSD